ncbi:iron-regulated frpA domain protein [Neisseria meningitidis NM3139]|nr:iron-regulated frpA domain protein [Neisseria meningitidis NM3139]
MTYANFNINGFGDVKLTPYSPLLGYKAWDSFIGSIQSLSDLILMWITIEIKWKLLLIMLFKLQIAF